ncbi:MAG: hypothetical protein ACK5Z5_05960 [Neisseriaceae bacterium]
MQNSGIPVIPPRSSSKNASTASKTSDRKETPLFQVEDSTPVSEQLNSGELPIGERLPPSMPADTVSLFHSANKEQVPPARPAYPINFSNFPTSTQTITTTANDASPVSIIATQLNNITISLPKCNDTLMGENKYLSRDTALEDHNIKVIRESLMGEGWKDNQNINQFCTKYSKSCTNWDKKLFKLGIDLLINIYNTTNKGR